MFDLSSLPADFVNCRARAVEIAALEEAAAATSTAIPPTLRALYEAGVQSLGEVHLFEEDLLDQYNVPAPPWAAELAHSDNPAERLIGEISEDTRMPGLHQTLCFASDNGGVVALVDGTNTLGRGVGAVFAVYPGAPEDAKLIAPDFDGFVDKALAYFRAEGPIDLISLARWSR